MTEEREGRVEEVKNKEQKTRSGERVEGDVVKR